MNASTRPLRVALTGGIATGKSHVLGRFEALGVPTIDADSLARDAVRPGRPEWAAIRTRFGSDVLLPDGEIDRQKLADVVFADRDARIDLEAIVHPPVYKAIAQWYARLGTDSQVRLGIADIPLLFETGHERDFDRVIVVACAPEAQVARLVWRNSLTEAQARQRLAAQWPIDQKTARADFVINTDASFEDTDRQVREVLDKLRQLADIH